MKVTKKLMLSTSVASVDKFWLLSFQFSHKIYWTRFLFSWTLLNHHVEKHWPQMS